MMIADIFKLSFQNLSRRKTRSYLTMIGIIIGIAAVVSLIGLGEGLREAIIGQFGFLGIDVLSVQAKGGGFGGAPGSGAAEPLHEDLVEKVNQVDGVKIAFGREIKSGRLHYEDESSIETVASVPSGEARKTFERMTDLEAAEGRLLEDGDDDIVVGNNFLTGADYEGLHVNDKVTINEKDAEIIGGLEKQGSFIFDNVLFMNTETMDEVFSDTETVDIIAVQVQDVDRMDRIKENVEKVLREERDVEEGKEDFTVETPQSILDNLESILFAVQLFITIIALISLLVGGIGITNTMYTAVLERTKEIGILKAIGATNPSVFSIFLFESGILGMIGGAIGVLLGVGLANGLAFVGRLALGSELIQAQISLVLIFGALLFSFVIGVMAGFLPAYQAASKNPVDALRFSK